MNPQYTNVKVEGPSFPTKGQLVFAAFRCLTKKNHAIPLYWMVNKDPYNGLL